jgi:hypothetical protein
VPLQWHCVTLRRKGTPRGATPNRSLITPERVAERILYVRGHKVLLDADLARMYGVTTGALNQAVKRNGDRFPDDFMFELTAEDSEKLKSQSVISSSHGGRRRSRPVAFTEQGVAMLSSVLRSKRAVQVNVQIMRTFVKLRQMVASHEELSAKLAKLEAKYDENFRIVFDAIRQLLVQDDEHRKRPRIGYHTEAAQP